VREQENLDWIRSVFGRSNLFESPINATGAEKRWLDSAISTPL